MSIEVGTRVELRKHAADRDRQVNPHDGVRLYEGIVEGTDDGRLVVRWDNGIVDTRPASHLTEVRMTGRRLRHEELRQLKNRVEVAGSYLRDAVRELYVPQECKREYVSTGAGYHRDFVGIHDVDIFDERRAEYDGLVAEYNRKARRHDRDNCC